MHIYIYMCVCVCVYFEAKCNSCFTVWTHTYRGGHSVYCLHCRDMIANHHLTNPVMLQGRMGLKEVAMTASVPLTYRGWLRLGHGYTHTCNHVFMCLYFMWKKWFVNTGHPYSISQGICTRFCCALLCCGYAIVHNEITWSIYPYSSGLLCWHWGTR